MKTSNDAKKKLSLSRQTVKILSVRSSVRAGYTMGLMGNGGGQVTYTCRACPAG